MFKKIKNLFKKKAEQPDVDQIISNIKSRIAKSNGYAIEQFSLLKPKENTEPDPEYLNRNCLELKDFIISPEMNYHDLNKLCKLNNINLQISSGWHRILIDLLIELDKAGWNRKVSCIKEKYASLKFYAESKYDEIIEKFEHISEKTCETCGEKGNQRYNTSWDYVACRKHYLENRGFIKSTERGFELNGRLYLWKNVVDAIFEDRYTKKNELLTFTFNSDIIAHQGWSDNKLYISNGTIGYGEFLKGIPRNLKSLDYPFLDEYSAHASCMICGFIAVYNHICECCETDEWISKEKNYWDKEEYIKFYQSCWIEDEGPDHSDSYKNYLRDDFYKIISRPEETD
jgi:hypothetical protein